MNTATAHPPASPLAPSLHPDSLLTAMAGLLQRARRALAPAGDGWAEWRAATGGDPASARALVARLTPPALALARQVLGRHEDAEDVVQDSFLRLWSARPDDQQSAQIGTYFHTIVLNRCRSQLARRREWATDPDELLALQDQQPPAADSATSDPLDAARQHHQLHTALTGLPPRQRLALALWAYADADAAAIGQALGIDANAAHQLLHRAKRQLRSALTPGGTA
ncbi:RNA polymerase sigma factor [Hydrogenophaga sp. R2]|uniref:RNA polymerase sigma factor n=1 Tax=Hydrogenophaga sp. R2 TaxID=3132827 RepID=UPI003CE82EAB